MKNKEQNKTKDPKWSKDNYLEFFKLDHILNDRYIFKKTARNQWVKMKKEK